MPITTGKTIAIGMLSVCLSVGPGAGEELSGPEIETLIAGETVRLNTPLGISLPLFYREDGVVLGDISGFSAASMLAPREEGRWWVESNSMCQKWPTWYDGRQFCFKIRATGQGKIAWVRDDGASGTARVGK